MPKSVFDEGIIELIYKNCLFGFVDCKNFPNVDKNNL